MGDADPSSPEDDFCRSTEPFCVSCPGGRSARPHWSWNQNVKRSCNCHSWRHYFCEVATHSRASWILGQPHWFSTHGAYEGSWMLWFCKCAPHSSTTWQRYCRLPHDE